MDTFHTCTVQNTITALDCKQQQDEEVLGLLYFAEHEKINQIK